MVATVEVVSREGFRGGLPAGPPALSLDTTGQVCPYPALSIKAALDRLGPGELLEVLTNNEATALRSVPLLCRQAGAEFVVLREGPHAWRALIRRAEAR